MTKVEEAPQVQSSESIVEEIRALARRRTGIPS
jgi:hypothetical protein